MTKYDSNNSIRLVKILAIIVLSMVSILIFFLSNMILRRLGFNGEASYRTIVTSFFFLNPFLIAMVLLGFKEWTEKSIYRLNPQDKPSYFRNKLLMKRIQVMVLFWVAPICLSLIVVNTLRLIPDWVLILASIMSYPVAAGITMHILHSKIEGSAPS